jgi:hypothetical protein
LAQANAKQGLSPDFFAEVLFALGKSFTASRIFENHFVGGLLDRVSGG